ncbi:MAG TPA: hypothetical protein DC047_08940, partial [Blastocatellia bacterium]|nr:hypothetical protein [Blastocatellia bacterium]
MNDRNNSPASEQVSRGLIFAADLGGTHLRAATVDRTGRIHFRLKQNTPQVEDAEQIVEALVAAVNECEKQCAGAR